MFHSSRPTDKMSQTAEGKIKKGGGENKKGEGRGIKKEGEGKIKKGKAGKRDHSRETQERPPIFSSWIKVLLIYVLYHF